MDTMDETAAVIESILREDESSEIVYNDDHGWKTVSYSKRQKKQTAKPPANSSDLQNSGDVFSSIEQHSEERRRRALESQKAAMEAATASNSAVKSNADDGLEDGNDVEASGGVENGGTEAKKLKPKKPKKPKVSVSDAAVKIDASDLVVFLDEITASYESQQDIQLMRFADYFGRAFAPVSASQFPWMRTLKETSVAKMVDIPLSHISEAVYKTSVDWLNQRSLEALGSFVLWSMDSILADLAIHQGAVKGPKKVVQDFPAKSQVAMFVILAMTLRRKPDVLISLLPVMRENPSYQGQDKLPFTVWLIAQACQGDLVVGLFMWAHFLLPTLSNKSSANPQSRDLILQLVERIVSAPKARPILLNNAVRKGERLVPPSALELLMRATFPARAARVKATERFEAVYPTLKEVCLAGVSGSKAMKQITQQTVQFAIKAAGEGVPDLSREASDVFIWCLSQNPECYKQWDNLYLDNLKASVVVLRKLSDEWKEQSAKHSTLEPLRATLKNFRQKNEKELAIVEDAAHQATLKNSEKYCKLILGQLSRGHGCMKSMVFISVALAVGAAVMSQNMDSWDLKKLLVDVNFPYTF
ncbi:uncharacterized protein LOC132266301 [Cornus florida]|uniref:uncharacterized protein LOC132266301 n=1 Tax=Cornus florida TaxID=4283 RepID=UPI0028A2ADB9|nr:uncharacterized protein LOC132266301 [Cornus florida]